MELHLQTSDHVVAVEKVAAQHIGTKYCKCNSLEVISHIIILGKSAITHSKVGQSSPNPKNFEERKNSLGQVIYQKCVTVVVSEKTAWPTHARTHALTHAPTHTHGANYNLLPATHFCVFFIYSYEGICMSSLPIVNKFLRLVVVLTVSPAKLYAED